MGDEQDGDMVVEFAEKTEERFGVLLVQIGGRFVQKEQQRFGGEGLRDEHALPLAAGKFCEGVLCEILHADVMETLHRDVAVVFTVAAEKMAFDASHEDDVERGRGEVRIVEDGLRDVADPLSGGLRLMTEHLDSSVLRSRQRSHFL